MKTLNLFILLCVLGVCCSSCEEEYFFYGKEIEGEFIEAEMNGQVIRMAAHDGYGSSDAYFFSTLQLQGDTVDQLNLIRFSSNGTESFSIYGFNLRLLDSSFPLFIPSDPEDVFNEPYISFEYKQNRITDREIIFNGTLDLTIDSWDEEDYMQGTFSGTVIATDGTTRTVENGTFRIQVSRP